MKYRIIKEARYGYTIYCAEIKGLIFWMPLNRFRTHTLQSGAEREINNDVEHRRWNKAKKNTNTVVWEEEIII